MILKQLQDFIGDIYDVSISHDVYDFLVTDRRQLPAAARSSGPTDEELIIAQPEEGDTGEIAMSLYLDPELLERLDRADPMERLHDGNVADYWTALEGVSHFVYLAWNAGHDKPVSLLELEMQAEVDKYVGSYWLMRRQFPDRFHPSCCGCCSRGRASTRAWRPDGRIYIARPAATRKSSADGWSNRCAAHAGARRLKCWPSCGGSIG
jgi:hypothetical protein